MRNYFSILLRLFCAWLCCAWIVGSSAIAQRQQFPDSSSGLRPISPGQTPTTSPKMVPINPATQAGIYPSTGLGSQSFDPYAVGSGMQQPQLLQSQILPPGIPPATPYSNSVPLGGYPTYNGASPLLPGAGQSATIGTFQNTAPGYTQPGMYPNSAPSALFPGATYDSSSTSGSVFGNFYNWFGGSNSGYGGTYGGAYGQPTYPAAPNSYGYPGVGGSYPSFNPNTWNPQGTIFTGGPTTPQFIRLFQGPRFRHTYLHGTNSDHALMINDSDLALAFAFPNFFYSTQPLYLMPSFSLHQWSGPRAPRTADLPPLAYSAFLDSGWQSDPGRILGAELGLRVGMFSDFHTAISHSLRVQGRAIGRVRITPRSTLKGGVIYIDRNKLKLLPAAGILWQPNPETRFDLFFPEPKLAHALSTLGTVDTWWYVAGYYGGGAWTVKRESGAKQSVDINDLRLVLGFEWGRNEQMRDGRRIGFLEIGYVFERELLYREASVDNLDLQDTIMFRAGFGF